MSSGTKPEFLRKSPATSRNYYVDFGGWYELAVLEETLSSGTVSIAPTGPTLGSVTVSGTKLVFRIAGGTAGVAYTLTVSAVTSESNTLSCKPELRVEDI